jgi:hypothetical protein
VLRNRIWLHVTAASWFGQRISGGFKLKLVHCNDDQPTPVRQVIPFSPDTAIPPSVVWEPIRVLLPFTQRGRFRAERAGAFAHQFGWTNSRCFARADRARNLPEAKHDAESINDGAAAKIEDWRC